MVDELDGKVLVAKPGKQAEFEQALQAAIKIAQGSLGWQGQAEMFWEMGIAPQFGVKTKSKKKGIAKLKELIQQSYLQSIYEVGEWIPEEQAEGRRIANKVLFGPK